MATVKKFNTESNKWEVIATSEASEISVRSGELLPEDKKETNVEDALLKLHNDVEHAKSNISWLALYGGGGSGGGGGSTVSAEITVNGEKTDSKLIFDEEIGLIIKVQASSSILNWNITATGDNKVIASTANAKQLIITKKDLERKGISKSFSLIISAENIDTLTQVFWNGFITIPSVKLDTINTFKYSRDKYKNFNLTYNYNVEIISPYNLVVNDKVIKNIDITNKEGSFEIPLLDLLGENPIIGSQKLYSYLVNVENPKIKSPIVITEAIITADDPVISCLTISKDATTPTNYILNKGGSSILLVPFTVYFIQGAYRSIVYTEFDKKPTVSDFVGLSYKQYNVEYGNESCVLNWNGEYGDTIKVYVSILLGAKEQIYTETFYIKAEQQKYKFLKTGQEANKIFDFTSIFGKINNGIWNYENSASLKIHNINENSSNIDKRGFLRFQNTSYATVESLSSKSFRDSLIESGIPQFTLCLSYKCDFHSDDKRTVLQWGNQGTSIIEDTNHIKQESPLINGIIIKDHKLWVNTSSLDLEDNEQINLIISFQSKNVDDRNGNLFIYLNGVLETVYSTSFNYLFGSDDNPYNDVFYLGTGFFNLDVDKAVKEYTDIYLNRFALYKKCLNPYEVLLDNLNTEACVHSVNLQPDISCIEDGLKRNFATQDKDGNANSVIWNKETTFNNNATDFFDNFSINKLVYIDASGNTSFVPNINNDFNIPIPMLLLDLSKGSSWTWKNFTTPDTDLSEIGGCSFEYFDQHGSNKSVIKGTVSVKLQGTSTLADYIKNLTISFEKDAIFIPKETWFPEKSYTLKADIVDSSHSLNTSIGKFVNQELGIQYKDNGEIASSSSWYPYSQQVFNSFTLAKNNKTSDMNKYFPKATLKHGIEGFPVFLIVRFAKGEENDKEIATLGIYQFILGRDSERNLGYEIVDKVEGLPSEGISYPFYKDSKVSISTKSNKGYWLEFVKNEGISKDLPFEELDENSFKKSKFIGPFWQPTNTLSENEYYNNAMEIKYSNLGAEGENNIKNITPFTDFVNNIIKLPVTNRYESFRGSNILNKNTFENTTYPKYVFKEKKNEVNNSTFEWVNTGETNVILGTGDNLTDTVSKINLESISKFFVIAMFLGLIDNFQKNLPFKFYKDANGNWEAPILGIYDTDTGCGGNNQASLNVPEYVWLSPIKNTGDFTFTSTSVAEDNNKEYSVLGRGNKLWYLDSDALNYSLGETGVTRYGSIYAKQWFSLLSFLNITDLNQLVDLFVDKYFIPQTQGCGELLFNLTYFAKYVNEYNGKNNQIKMLHGRRIYQIKNWLKNRVKFLHSIFTAMATNDGAVPNPISPDVVSLITGLSPTFTMVFNNPVLVRHSPQGSNTYYCFCKPNEEVPVYWGSSENTIAGISQTLTQSDSIQKLGNNLKSLASVYFAEIRSGNLPNLIELNLSNCTSLQSNAKFMDFFLSDKKTSELRVLDLSNTSESTNGTFIIDLSKGFSKLQKLDLSNSCVSNLILPINPNIPLVSLDIQGSNINELNLNSQNLLEKLNLTNCKLLTNLTITNCDKITSLNLDSSQRILQKVTIASDTFREFTCKDNQQLTTLEISSESIDIIELKDCPKLTTLSISGGNLRVLKLSGCTSLNKLIIGNPDKIETLDLSGTNLKYLTIRGITDTSKIDLTDFNSLVYFNISSNPSVRAIQFKNNPNYIFNITNNFSGCISLERVYGNLGINTSSVFYDCPNFSIHGSDIEKVTYKGKPVVINHVVQHPKEINGITDENGKPLFLEGSNVTNITFITNYGYSAFEGTNCTLFDVYYIFSNLGALTNATRLFWNCKNAKFDWSYLKDEKDTFIQDETGNKILVDNSPNIHLFDNAQQLENISQAFTLGTYKLIGPESELEYPVKNNGLLSPLINCVSMYDTWVGTSYIDRSLFRRVDPKEQYAITQLGLNRFTYIVDNVRDLKKPFESIDDIKTNINSLGNLSNFFINLQNLSGNNTPSENKEELGIKGWVNGLFSGTYYINWDKTKNFKIPLGVTGLHRSFIMSYASGLFDFSSLFAKENSISSLVNLTNSFCVLNDISDLKIPELIQVHMDINTDFFTSFTKLSEISYNNKNIDYSTPLTAIGYMPFEGINKQVIAENASTFLTNLLLPCKDTLTKFDGFFIKTNLPWTNTELPGKLFKETTKLKSINRLFEHLIVKEASITLTSNSFENCPKLTEAYRLFMDNKKSFKGFIPRKFFFHGYHKKSIKMTLYNIEEKEYDPNKLIEKVDAFGVVYWEPQGIPEGTPTKQFEYTYNEPNTSLKLLTDCFRNNSFECYKQTNLDETLLEDNPNYCPYNWAENGKNHWKAMVVDNNTKTFKWAYDGLVQWDFSKRNDVEIYDSGNIEITNIYKFGNYLTGSLNFICAPDLFRYCINSNELKIDGVFAECGHLGNKAGWDGRNNDLQFGIKGRIVPYLLEPIEEVTNISRLFKFCDWISSYSDGFNTYLIPKDFFKYGKNVTNLKETFSGLCFGKQPYLNVFSYLKNPLNIQAIFRYPKFEDNTIIKGIFKSNYIIAAQEAFCTFPLRNHSDEEEYNTNLSFQESSGWINKHKVTFDGIFTPALLLGKPDWFVFAGYNSENVQFLNKSCEDSSRKNYTTKN